MTLYEETVELLANRSTAITYEIMSNETGLSVSWINYFLHKRIKEPSVFKVELLNNYLKSRGSSGNLRRSHISYDIDKRDIEKVFNILRDNSFKMIDTSTSSVESYFFTKNQLNYLTIVDSSSYEYELCGMLTGAIKNTILKELKDL